ncbi:MAG TPA: DUF1800 domain-containing protein [Terriglobales bacterium]|nr:DUF1800 domain-containing protein [Terriglobales bacterium]
MRMTRNGLTSLVAAGVVVVGLLAAAGFAEKRAKTPQLDESKRALHALNRLTFGPRPGEVDRVARMGVDKWIEQQLHPESIDDGQLEARLSGFRTLKMDSRTLAQNFPPPQVIKAVAQGRRPLPNDPEKRAVYESAIDRYEQRREKKLNATDKNSPNGNGNDNGNSNDTATGAPADPSEPDMRAGANGGGQPATNTADAGNGRRNRKNDDPELRARRREARMNAEANADDIMALPPERRMDAVVKMPPEDRRALIASLPPDQRQQLMNSFTPEQRERLQAMQNPIAVPVSELQQAKILRAAYSERQLEEVMTDFWFNHFNVYLNKGADRLLVGEYEREVIRPHALGKFQDLLEATAKSPAMLFYLDNWQSIGPHSDAAEGRARRNNNGGGFRRNRRGPFARPFPGNEGGLPRPQPQQAKKRSAGLNENYGRELMELHTLGVNGGYTQADVTEVARVFTGWTIRQPQQGGSFEFDERRHEPGDKHVLGHTIKEHGQKEGEEVLKILAEHPSTAKFISTKLAMRFVSDTPPASLVDRMSKTYLKTHGDIREVLRTMFRSEEFWSQDAYRAKVKTPLEFVASAIRATGVDVANAMPLVGQLNRMGMPLYQMQPPTGYSMKAEAWVNSSALLARMNFALALGSGRMPGLRFDPEALLNSPPPTSASAAMPASGDDAQATLAMLESALLAGDVSAQTHDTIVKQLNDPQVTGRRLDDPRRAPNAGVIAGLILGSPEFQRR